MKSLIYTLIILFIFSCSIPSESSQINGKLKRELDSIYQLEQGLRKEFHLAQNTYGGNSRQADSIWLLVEAIDSSNLVRIKQIIHENGYPGKSLVGSGSCEVAFFVLQHSPIDVMESYEDVIIQAGKNDELSMKRVVMYVDRLRIHKDLPQVYGTQVRVITSVDPISDQSMIINVFYPIENITEVDIRRKEVGLQPLAEYAAKNNIRMNY